MLIETMDPLFAKPSDFFLLHYSRHFGKPFDIQTFRSPEGEGIRLATFDLRYRQFKIYGSLGLSDEPEVENLGEIILLSDDFRPQVRELFLHFLLFILQRDIPLGSQFCLGGIERVNPDFADQYDKSALYVMTAKGFDKGFDEFDVQEEKGKVYQGIFISATEEDFLRRNTPEVFERRLLQQEEKEDLCTLSRPSCVA